MAVFTAHSWADVLISSLWTFSHHGANLDEDKKASENGESLSGVPLPTPLLALPHICRFYPSVSADLSKGHSASIRTKYLATDAQKDIK